VARFPYRIVYVVLGGDVDVARHRAREAPARVLAPTDASEVVGRSAALRLQERLDERQEERTPESRFTLPSRSVQPRGLRAYTR
jgi:hypothetical protein